MNLLKTLLGLQFHIIVLMFQLIYLTVQFVPIYMEKKNCYIFF